MPTLEIIRIGQVQFEEFVNVIDTSLFESIKRKQNVIENARCMGRVRNS